MQQQEDSDSMRNRRTTRRGSAAIEYVCVAAVLMAILLAMVPVIRPVFDRPLADALDGALTKSTEVAPTKKSPPPVEQKPTMSLVERLYLLEVFFLVIACLLALYALRKYRAAFLKHGAGEPAVCHTVAKLSSRLFEKRHQIQLAISTHWHTTMSTELIVSELMTQRPKAFQPDDPRRDLEAFADDTGVHHILVVDDSRLIGVISDRDLRERAGATAKEIMTPNPKSVSPGTTVSEAIGLMLSNRVSCIPVVRDGSLCGILTASDIAMGFQCTLRVLDQIARAITDPASSAEVATAVSVAQKPGRHRAVNHA